MSRREGQQQEGVRDDPPEGGRRPAVGLVPERVVRGRGRAGRQLQPDRVPVRGAQRRGERGDHRHALSLSISLSLPLSIRIITTCKKQLRCCFYNGAGETRRLV